MSGNTKKSLEKMSLKIFYNILRDENGYNIFIFMRTMLNKSMIVDLYNKINNRSVDIVQSIEFN